MAFGGGREACPCRPGLACLQKIAVLYSGMHLFDPEMTLFAREQGHSGGGVPLLRAGMLHFVRERFHFIYEMSSFTCVILYFAHERSSFARVMLHSGPERSSFARVMLHSGPERSSLTRVMLHSEPERSSFARVMLHSGPERSSFTRVMLHSGPERSSLTSVMLHSGRGMLYLAGEMLRSMHEPLLLGAEVLHLSAKRGSVGNFVFEAVLWRPRRHRGVASPVAATAVGGGVAGRVDRGSRAGRPVFRAGWRGGTLNRPPRPTPASDRASRRPAAAGYAACRHAPA